MVVLPAVLRWLRQRVPARHGHGWDTGSVTAEYAVVAVAVCAFGAVLLKILTGDAVASALSGMVERALDAAY